MIILLAALDAVIVGNLLEKGTLRPNDVVPALQLAVPYLIITFIG